MVYDLLQLGSVDGEQLLQLLDLLEEVLGHVGHGTWATVSGLGSAGKRGRGFCDAPLREGGCRGPIPTMVAVDAR